MSAPRDALGGPVGADAVVCRCEAVRLSHLREAREAFDIQDLRQLKLLTRSGMGMCQGRVCRPALEALARSWGFSAVGGALAVRPPLRPRPMAAYLQDAPVDPADGAGEGGGPKT